MTRSPAPESCIQRTEGRLTGRGYDTTGIAYQYVVNRFNEVLGVGGFRVHREVKVKEVQRSNGRPAFEAICDLTLELGEWTDGNFVTFAESIADGGHLSSSEADAKKGAYTNAFKKAAAFHGVGKQAYEGTLDDDNVLSEGVTEPTQVTQPSPRSAVAASNASVVATPPATPTGYVRTGPVVDTRATTPDRNRLSSKQLSAIWSIARKLGVEQAAFRPAHLRPALAKGSRTVLPPPCRSLQLVRRAPRLLAGMPGAGACARSRSYAHARRLSVVASRP